MSTIAEILPSLSKKTRNRYAAALRKAGLISPQPLGDGMAYDYAENEGDTLRQFAALMAEGLSSAEALGRMSHHVPPRDVPACPGLSRHDPGHVPACPTPAGETAPPAAPDPALVALRDELAAVRERVESEAAARAAADLARAAAEHEARAIAEQARTLTETVRDLDEERKNHRARIANMERERTAPRTLRERIRAALDVLLGRGVAVVAYLPAPRERDAFERAA